VLSFNLNLIYQIIAILFVVGIIIDIRKLWVATPLFFVFILSILYGKGSWYCLITIGLYLLLITTKRQNCILLGFPLLVALSIQLSFFIHQWDYFSMYKDALTLSCISTAAFLLVSRNLRDIPLALMFLSFAVFWHQFWIIEANLVLAAYILWQICVSIPGSWLWGIGIKIWEGASGLMHHYSNHAQYSW